MTIRQVWVRVKALPHDAPLWAAERAAIEKAEKQQRDTALDDALTRYQPKKG
jgi:hypothetical protein